MALVRKHWNSGPWMKRNRLRLLLFPRFCSSLPAWSCWEWGRSQVSRRPMKADIMTGHFIRAVEAVWSPARAQEKLFKVLLCSARRCRNTFTSPKIQFAMRQNTGWEKDEVLLFLHPDQLRISCQHLIFLLCCFFSCFNHSSLFFPTL